jgi:tetratricopeptide (TPR) repeat protein
LKVKSKYSPLCVPAVFLAALLLASCSTKKNTLVNRSFHNLSAHYNGYFNAREILREAILKMETEYVDDYSRILPMWTYGNPKDAKAATPAMEKVFKKCSTVIDRHSMKFKGVEKVKWIDDNFMLIGLSHFYRHDYFSGVEVFEFVISEYKKQPSRYDAFLWLIKTYNELGLFTKAQGYIDLCKSDRTFPFKKNGELAAVTADFHIKQENYELAIKELNKALVYSRNKKEKARWTFILAQLYQRINQPQRAISAFSQVVKLNPKYELAFYSKILKAKLYDKTASSSVSIKDELNKMLKDKKNIDYYDQIFYALAEIALKDGDEKQAVELLKKSMASVTNNNTQKGLSALLLADIYFERPEYNLAEAFYDTAVGLISKDYPGYEIIKNKKENLTKLVNNYRLIAREDSLLQVAGLDPQERLKKIDRLIEKEKQEAAKKKEEEEALAAQSQNQSLNQQTPKNQAPAQGSGSTFYFNNPSTLSFGFSEFAKKWGNRKLEDNWRRSNKQQIAPSGTVDETSAGISAASKDTMSQEQLRAIYLKNLPMTDEAKNSSRDKIIDAYYDLSLIYKESLGNLPKSAESLEILNGKYPGNKYEQAAFYQLYRLYMGMKQEANAAKNREIILTRFPDSDYAKILLNPDYNSERQKKADKVTELYSLTYQLYEDGSYRDALGNCLRADSMDLKNPVKGQFALLKALCIGRTSDIKAFEMELSSVVVNYPKEPVKDRAQEILDYIRNMNASDPNAKKPGDKGAASNQPEFKSEPESEHLFVLVFAQGQANPSQVASVISDFNDEYFSASALSVNPLPLQNGSQAVTVRMFSNAQKAMGYFAMYADQLSAQREMSFEKQYFVVSKGNFAILMKAPDISVYLTFFEAEYGSMLESAKGQK